MATIRKRGKRYQVQVRRQGYKGVSRTFYRLKDAQVWARQTEARADITGLNTDPGLLKQTTLAALVTKYRDEVVISKKGARDETIVLNAFLRHPICEKRLSGLTSADFATYRDERLRHVRPSTVKRQLNPLRHMFEVAKHEWGLPIEDNPVAKVKLKSVDNRRERRLEAGELSRILIAARCKRNFYFVPIVLFALETAMRRSEVLRMQWRDISWERRTVTLTETKNGHSRCVPLAPKAISILSGLPRHNEFVFPTTANAVRLLWQRVCKDAGIEDLHFHDLRHEAISRFFEMGLTVPEVALLSGHHDPRMLFRYTHPIQEKILETFDKVKAPPTVVKRSFK